MDVVEDLFMLYSYFYVFLFFMSFYKVSSLPLLNRLYTYLKFYRFFFKSCLCNLYILNKVGSKYVI